MNTHIFLFTEKGIAANYGIGTYLDCLKEALQTEKNFRISIVELLSKQKEVEVANHDGIQYIYIPANLYGKKNYYRNTFYILWPYIPSEEQLIFHLNFMNCNQLAEFLKSHFNRARVILTVHYTQCDIAGVFSEKVAQQEAKLMRWCDKVIVLTQQRRNQLVKQYGINPSHIAIIPHGIRDTYRELSKEKQAAIRTQLGIEKERIILYAGRLDENKRVRVLIEAFKIILAKIPNVHLLIAGEGTSLPSLLQTCRGILGKTTFTGFVDKKNLYDFYSIASVGVLPSRFEELGFVALEMMMHALPIVASNTLGLQSIIQQTQAGLLVDLNKENENDMAIRLAQPIIRLIQDKQLSQQYGENGRNAILNEYSLNTFRKNIIAAYKGSE
ncbi:glycosyltransferase [uncultured Bacteroides sp.]|jgi:glycosyltransferase involved in cell wall biosynthesis|uniref:glycosyltransferase n=1 Tax=uncultured Bacteroides sp. TaxID=162156 RepID=UPI0025DDDE59|nr:glycosyltransferase [uncultured Bacteroides sp.]